MQQVEIYYAIIFSVQNPVKFNIWDSRMSFHLTPHKKFKFNYFVEDFVIVHLVDGELMNVLGVDDVQIKTNNGTM